MGRDAVENIVTKQAQECAEKANPPSAHQRKANRICSMEKRAFTTPLKCPGAETSCDDIVTNHRNGTKSPLYDGVHVTNKQGEEGAGMESQRKRSATLLEERCGHAAFGGEGSFGA
jgi:hypothetical protein